MEEHHADNKYRLWPDLVSSHYANETIQWFLQQKIEFVAKQVNGANVAKVTIKKKNLSEDKTY